MPDLKELKPLSDLAKSIWQMLADRHSGMDKAIPREKLYKWMATWDEYRNVRGGKPISFRAFRNAKLELVKHRYRVGSCAKGWFRIVTAEEARKSAAYLEPHYRTIIAEHEMLLDAAVALDVEEEAAGKPKAPPGQCEIQQEFPPAVFQDDGTENILKRAKGEL